MNIIELKQHYSLGLELFGDKIRLIVFENGVERACRKEKIKTLLQFITERKSQLFKGRIRLTKKENEIIVTLKNSTVGNIYFREFERGIQEVQLINN